MTADVQVSRDLLMRPYGARSCQLALKGRRYEIVEGLHRAHEDRDTILMSTTRISGRVVSWGRKTLSQEP